MIQEPSLSGRWHETGSTVEWDRDGGARINNVLPATRKHPDSGETLWFNQVATFLSSPRSTGLGRWLSIPGCVSKAAGKAVSRHVWGWTKDWFNRT